MAVGVAAKISALLNGLTTDQLNELPPVERRKFAELVFIGPSSLTSRARMGYVLPTAAVLPATSLATTANSQRAQCTVEEALKQAKALQNASVGQGWRSERQVPRSSAMSPPRSRPAVSPTASVRATSKAGSSLSAPGATLS